MKQKTRRKLLSFLLTLAMVIGLFSGMSLTAYAAPSGSSLDNPFDSGVTVGYASLVNTKTVVHFDSKDWYLIEDNSTAVDAGTVTLLSKECVGASEFNENDTDGNTYSGSTVESFVNSWYTSNISTEAQGAVNGNGMFLLTTDQANELSLDVRKCSQVDGADDNAWWLCSAGLLDINGEIAACVYGDNGNVNGDGDGVGNMYGVRPALKLDLSKVTFDSDTNTFTVGSATAVTEYPLWVGGTQVTSTNAGNIDGSNKASFDASTNTLKLNGVNITTGYKYTDSDSDDSYGVGIYYTGTEALNICLADNTNNTISVNVADCANTGIWTPVATVSFSGNGKLTVNETNTDDEGISAANINISDCELDVTCGNTGIGSSGDISIQNAKATAKAIYGIISNDYVDISADSIVNATGTERAIIGSVRNAVAGLGWTNTDGTEGQNNIAISTSGQDLSSYKKVQFTAKYSVTITPGKNMTKTANSGAESQSDLSDTMTAVVYTANDGYKFPGASNAYTMTNGITVAVSNDLKTITVSGIPTADTTITIPDAVEDTAQTQTHTHDGISFQPWTSTDSLPVDNGSYYLTNDVTLSEMWTVPGTNNLCLNGHSINGPTNASYVFNVNTNTTLNLYDCGVTAGTIIARYKNGVTVAPGSTFNLYGGKITSNTDNQAIGVENFGTFNMYGGEISGNKDTGVSNVIGTFTMTGGTIRDNGKGVANQDIFKLSGNPTITNNKSGTDDSAKDNNVSLADNKVITIDGVLSNTTPIGVTMSAPGVFTSGWNDKMSDKTPTDYFTSDDSAYTVQVDGNELKLAMIKTNPTVTAPTARNLIYNGQAQELVTAGTATGGTMYYAVTTENKAPTDESLYTTSIPSKTEAGTYYVWYMVKGDSGHSDVAAKSLIVSIAGKDISAAKVTLSNTSFMYDNSEKTVSVKKVTLGDKELAADDYEMSGTIKATDQGDYEVTVTGKGNYTGTVKTKWSIAKKTSEVVLETPSGVSTAVSDVACENLSSFTDSQTEDKVAVKLDVKPVAENSVDNNVASKIKVAIQEAFSGIESESTKTEYLDMKVTKTVNGGTAQEISDVSAVLEIELSYDLTGKYNPVIVREHGGKAMQFGRLSSKPLSGFKDGTFFVGNNSIFVYSRYFSTYSITYATTQTYQVTFDDATGNTNQIIVSSGGKVTRPADPTRSGYTFNGWYNGDKAYDFNSAVNSDITLTAKWTQNGSSGGSGGSGGGGTTPVTPGKTTPPKPAAPTLDSKTDTSITVKTVAGQEYSIDGGKTWQTSGTFTGLTPETEYSIVTKITATSTANESPVSDALKVTTDKKSDPSTPTPGSTTTPTDKPTETPGSTTAPTDTPSTTTTPGATDTPSTTTTPGATSTPADKVTKAEKAKAKLSLNAGLKVSYVGKKVTVKWGKVSKADRYVVYAAYCGPDKCTKIKTLSGSKASMTFTKLNGSKLNLKKNIKVYVVAYRKVNGKETKLAKSITAHVVGTKNAKYTNVKKIKLSKSSYTLKVDKTATVKAEIVLEDKKKKQLSDGHAPEFRYASSNTKVATVDENGKIKAVGKGTCYIYVYAKNGYAKKIKVTVK